MTADKKPNNLSPAKAQELRGQLLVWYDRHRRDLPWRITEGEKPDPYRVWLSEIMLQQTTVGAVMSYYTKFLEKWPTVHDLAHADQDDVMHEWAGLGYYARARNLHKCAQTISRDFKGHFPDTQKELNALPGIGEYTSAAITAIAFNKPANVVDGNIERITARLFNIHEPLPQSKKTLKKYASNLYSNYTDRPGDLAQALMDLGATVCIPQKPRCMLCPISNYCLAFKNGTAAALPKKEKKKTNPKRIGEIYWIQNDRQEILLHKRPEKGLLGGTMALPTSEWVEHHQEIKDIAYIHSTDVGQSVYHSFTHFDLQLNLRTLASDESFKLPKNHIWEPLSKVRTRKFPTVFQKAVNVFLLL